MNAKEEELDDDGQPKKRQRPMQIGAVTLTPERIERFNAIDFAWDLTGPTPRQSWEARFEQCMEYYRANGRWPPHSHGTLGEWVHKQRCKWARKDKAFMEKYYDKLEEVGFLWKVKERNSISWEARVEQLVRDHITFVFFIFCSIVSYILKLHLNSDRIWASQWSLSSAQP